MANPGTAAFVTLHWSLHAVAGRLSRGRHLPEKSRKQQLQIHVSMGGCVDDSTLSKAVEMSFHIRYMEI